jgi:Fe-S-cluster containining protein
MLIDFLKSQWNEILSYFVPEKVKYKITGECKKCGKCCNYMYSFDTYTEKEFKIMQFLYPAYKRFYIKGKDEFGNFIFACKYVTPEGLCSVYDKRLKMCKKYPAKYILYPAKMHEGCGFCVEEKNFKKYLEM